MRHKNHFSTVVLATAATLILATTATAQTTLYVDTANCPGPGDGSVGNPYCSIQAGIDAASHGDEVVVAPGTYVELIDLLGKAITVRSTDPDDPMVVLATVIDGNGLGTVVTCDSGEGNDTVLSGFVITGGSADYGGGMVNIGSSPTVMNCSFSENTAASGGAGMYNSNSHPVVTNCVFSLNTADFSGAGAGMFNTLSDPQLTNCHFIGNTSSGAGGGMYNSESDPTMMTCTFSGNSGSLGGGIFIHIDSSPTITACSIVGNSATAGGGVVIGTGNPTLIDTIVCGNRPAQIGGAYLDGGGNQVGHHPPPLPPVDPCPADINDSDAVNVTDLLLLLAAWGACP